MKICDLCTSKIEVYTIRIEIDTVGESRREILATTQFDSCHKCAEKIHDTVNNVLPEKYHFLDRG